MKSWLLACAALLATIVAAFHPLWLRGESLTASLRGPGITRAGPYGTEHGTESPVSDAVAANIDEPLARVAARQLAAGELPVWNPHNALGVPLLGNWQTALPNPLRALVHAFPDSTWAFDVTYLLRLVIAGTGALMLARRLGLGALAALAAGIVFGLTGYFVRHVQMHHLNGEVWLPWLWLGADVLAQRRSLGAVLGFGGIAFAATIAGNPQPALVAVVASLAFALTRARQWGARGAGYVFGTGVAAVMLASIWWVSGLEYIACSEHGYHTDFPVGTDHYTMAGALGLLVPQPYRMPAWLFFVAPYLGVAAYALALMGAGRGLGRSVLLWVMVAALTGKLFGLPGTEPLAWLPGFSQMKQFKYLYPPLALALALLAGNGVAALAAGITVRRAAFSCGAIAVWLLAFTIAGSAAAGAADAVELIAGHVALAAGFLAALFVVAWWAPARWRAPLAVGLVALELLLAAPDRWIPRAPLYKVPPALAKLAHLEPASFRTLGAAGVLMPNQNAALGIDDLRLHDGVFPERYGQYVRRLLVPNVLHFPVFTAAEDQLGLNPPQDWENATLFWSLFLPQSAGRNLPKPKPVDLFEPGRARQLDLMNVRFFVLPADPDLETLVAALPKEQYQLFSRDDRLLVVERKHALPRAFVPTRVERVSSVEQALELMAEDSFDPRQVAYLETSLPTPGGEFVGSARVVARPSPTVLELHAQIDRAGWLVVSIYPYPGLTAYVGGKRARVFPVNATMVGVQMPLGRHEVRLVYEPTWRAKVFWTTLAGAALLLLLACAAHWRATVPHAD